MAHTNLAHRRTHNLLLISKLLTQRDHVSPFTLVLDSLEQTAKPLIREYIRRAQSFKTYTVFLGFETTVQPHGVDYFLPCYDKSPAQISQTVTAAVGSTAAKRVLILIDSLQPFCCHSLATSQFDLTAYLSSLLAPPRPTLSTQISMVAVLHQDIPLPAASQSRIYQPAPLQLLLYLATTVLELHSLQILLATKYAEDRSLAAPIYGLSEEKEGIIIGFKPTTFSDGRTLKAEDRGIVLELEHRRKSGRGVREWYVLPEQFSTKTEISPQPFKEIVILLDDHPLFRKPKGDDLRQSDQTVTAMTFELGLTDRQRQERDGVVLPYFDAQRAGGLAGPGEGGRILYDMGEEDDFDEEEDEI